MRQVEKLVLPCGTVCLLGDQHTESDMAGENFGASAKNHCPAGLIFGGREKMGRKSTVVACSNKIRVAVCVVSRRI